MLRLVGSGRACRACGGPRQRVKARGRLLEVDGAWVDVPEGIELDTCLDCGELHIDDAKCAELRKYLELRRRFEDAAR